MNIEANQHKANIAGSFLPILTVSIILLIALYFFFLKKPDPDFVNNPLFVSENGDKSLLVEFNFDEPGSTIIKDSSGKGYDGEIKERDDDGNAVPVADVSSYWNTKRTPGSSLKMDGMEFNSNSIIEIAPNPDLSGLTDKITVMAWINRNLDSTIPEIGKIPNVAIFAHDYSSFFFGYHNSMYKLEFFTDDGGQASCYVGEYNPGIWEHMVGTYDGNTAKLYVNGKEICSEHVTGNMLINTNTPVYNTFTIGAFYDKRDMPVKDYGNKSAITDELDGSMDNFRVYNRALGQEEIQAIYQVEDPYSQESQ